MSKRQECARGEITTIGGEELNYTAQIMHQLRIISDAIFGSEFTSFVKSVGTKCTKLCGPVGFSRK